jgi:hypothetical protein
MGDQPIIDQDRPVAGEADDATRKAELRKRLAEKESASSAPTPATPAEKDSAGHTVHHDTDINTMNPADNIRKGKKRIDDAIEDDSK